jgi:hypothetical protein
MGCVRRLIQGLMTAGALYGCSSQGAAPTMGRDAGASESVKSDAGFAALRFSDIGAAILVNNQFYWTEGPVWDPTKNVLYFTDINAPDLSQDSGDLQGADGTEPDAQPGGVDADRDADAPEEDSGEDAGGDGGAAGGQNIAPGGAIYRFTPPSTIEIFFLPDGNADGLGLDSQYNPIAAGYVSRGSWRLSTSSTMEMFAPCAQGGGTCYMSQELNTPDDITARADGVIYFTDPTFGSGAQGFPAQTSPSAVRKVFIASRRTGFCTSRMRRRAARTA